MFNRIFTVLVFALLTSLAWAQTPKKETATVSGTVTLNGSPVKNAAVALMLQNQLGPQQPLRTRTDAEGRFRFSGVAAGQYSISALTPGFYSPTNWSSGMPGQALYVGSGETIENVNLPLKRGAVITGSVLDENNDPISEIPVQLIRAGERSPSPQSLLVLNGNQTDDRGVYRLYGLPPGKYQVSVGIPVKEAGYYGFQNTRTFIEQTFHPDTTDLSQAKIIELEEGQSATDVDIRVGKWKSAYEVSGRVVDAQTGQPVVGVNLGYSPIEPSTKRMSGWRVLPGMLRTDANGEFHSLMLRPGQYALYAQGDGDKVEFYTDPAKIEITNRDLEGIELRAERGASISGLAIIEGTSDPMIQASRSQIRLSANIEEENGSINSRSASVKPDGSFRIIGIKPGKVRLSSFQYGTGLSLVRIEINGTPIKDNKLEIRAGEQIANVRAIYAQSKSSIRGQVIIVGIELQEGMQLSAFVRKVGSNATEASVPVDARGNFVLENLPPGEYTVQLSCGFRGASTPEINAITRRISNSSQRITVANNSQAQVNFTIDLTPEGKKQ